MIGINLLSKLAKLSFSIIYVLFFLKLVPIKIANSLVIAQNSPRKTLDNHLVFQQKQTQAPDPPEPDPEGNPPTTTEEPKRGPCGNMNESLTALLPSTGNQNKVLISQEKPKFWFYVPYERNSINSVKLTWTDKERKNYLTEDLPKPIKPGFVSVSVPSQALPLKNSKQYSLMLTINVYCDDSPDAKAEPDSVPITVQVQEFHPPQSKTAIQRAQIYAEKGFVFDALTQIAPLKEKNPKDPNWNQLLRSMNLKNFKAITTKPIVDCCTPRSRK